MLQIRLLGPPSIVGETGPRSLPGWKPWGLLAHLLLTDASATRPQLCELLWPAADDPGGALRWALFQVRKAIAPASSVTEAAGRLEIDLSNLSVDALRLLKGDLTPAEIEDLGSGTLLDTVHFAESPNFELWLGIEQARLDSALRSTFRWAATLSVSSDSDRALRFVERLLAMDPFDDAAHELAIDIHLTRGDRRAAESHIERVTSLYRAELGAEPPARLRRPIQRADHPEANPLIDHETSARAMFDVAQSRLTAGDYEGALDAARRASASGAASGNRLLEAQALMVLAESLIHGRRGQDQDAVGLLHRALRLATEAGAVALAADVERETGYIAFLTADYGAAESALHRSLSLAREAGDGGRAGRALTMLGACLSDQGAMAAAEGAINEALVLLEAAEDRRWGAYALSYMVRVHLAFGRAAEAQRLAVQSIRLARDVGWHAVVPFPMALQGEALLLSGHSSAARTTLGEALTIAREMDDPCWEALSLRGLALVEAAGGHHDEAHDLMTRALTSCRRFPDTYRWAELLILTELVELERGADPERRHAARRLAHDAGLGNFVRRIDGVVRPQTRRQTPRS